MDGFKNYKVCYDGNRMKVKINDLSKIFKGYSNEWVALDPDSMKVVARAKKNEDILKKARDRGTEHPVLTRVPSHYGTYILQLG